MVLLYQCGRICKVCNDVCGLKSRYAFIYPIIAILLYTLLGGWIFMTTERAHDEKLRLQAVNDTRRKVAYATGQLVKRLREIDSYSERGRSSALRQFLFWFAEQLGAQTTPGNTPWTFWGSSFFAGTIYTTIGYGNYSPVTVKGRIATVFYALFGIPLALIVLNFLGQLMIRFFKYVWSNCIACGKYITNRARNRKGEQDKPEFLGGPGEKLPADPKVPLSGALLIFLLWMLFSAAVFLLIERNWPYFKSLYFFFISLTTIGFGDVVPSDPDLAPFVLILLILGLAVISMCINIIQQEMEEMFQNLLQNMDSEYKTMQTGGDGGESGVGVNQMSPVGEEGEEEEAPLMGNGFRQLFSKRGFRDRLLMKTMNKSMRSQLEAKYNKINSMRNRGVQTDRVANVNDLIYDDGDEYEGEVIHNQF